MGPSRWRVLFQRGNFVFLGIDLLVQHGALSRHGLHRLVVLVERGGDEVHFGLKDFETLVYFPKRVFELLFAFQANFQAKCVGHTAIVSFPKQ